MRRRDILWVIGLSAMAYSRWRMAHSANRVYRIGFLAPIPPAVFTPWFQELSQLGFIEGENLVAERRGFGNSYDQFPALAAELIKDNPDAIICGGDAAIRAAQNGTSTMPIVGATDDMVGAGLAQSLSHPGGNTTGVSVLASELDGKRQELLFEAFPTGPHMAVLADPATTSSEALQSIRKAGRARGITVSVHEARIRDEIGAAVQAAKDADARALNVLASPLLFGERATIIRETERLRLPAIYQWPDTAQEGGLLGYGPRFKEFLRLWARQAAKVLRGTHPADLPIDQPTRFELAVNLKTATTIGAMLPAALINRADEVIE